MSHHHRHLRGFLILIAILLTNLACLDIGKMVLSGMATQVAALPTPAPDPTSAASLARTFTGPSAANDVAWSPDSALLATAWADGSVIVWEAGAGQAQRTLSVQPDEATRVAWSPDGDWIAAGTNKGAVVVWEAQTGQAHCQAQGHGAAVSDLAFAPDGRRFASVAENDKALVWDTATCEVVLTQDSASGALAWSPDGQSIASAAVLWDAETGESLSEFAGLEDRAAAAGTAFSPDGAWLASGSIEGGATEPGILFRASVVVWDAAKGQVVYQATDFTDPDHHVRWEDEYPVCVAWSPDGALLAFGTERSISVIDVRQQHDLRKLEAPRGSGDMTAVAWSPDGKTLAASYRGGAVILWDVSDLKPLVRPPALTGLADRVEDMAWSPDGTHLATTHGQGTVILWDAATQTRLYEIPAPQTSGRVSPPQVAFSPDGARLVSSAIASAELQSNGQVHITPQLTVRDAATGEAVLSLAVDQLDNADVMSLAWSSDGKHIAAGSWSLDVFTQGMSAVANRVTVWDAETGAVVASLNHTRLPEALLWISENQLAIAGHDGTLSIWNVETGDVSDRNNGGRQGVDAAAISPEGSRYALALRDEDYAAQIIMLDADTGKELYRIEPGVLGGVGALAFSPDDQQLAASLPDGTAVVYDVATGEKIAVLDWPKTGGRLAWSPDGTMLAVEGEGGIILWELEP